MSKFKVGDYVTLDVDSRYGYFDDLVGKLAIIRRCFSDSLVRGYELYSLEFVELCRDNVKYVALHNCDGFCPNNNGYNIDGGKLKLYGFDVGL